MITWGNFTHGFIFKKAYMLDFLAIFLYSLRVHNQLYSLLSSPYSLLNKKGPINKEQQTLDADK